LHELVLVSGIIDAVSRLAREKNRKVSRLTVAVGELASMDRGLIEDLLRELVVGTELEGAEISVEVEKARVKCMSCGAEWGFEDLVKPLSEEEREMIHFLPELVSSFSKCPACGSRYLRIESGRSVRVVEVELE